MHKPHIQNEGARQPEIAVKDTDLKATLEIYHQWSGGLGGVYIEPVLRAGRAPV